jgi:hypothetical protein
MEWIPNCHACESGHPIIAEPILLLQRAMGTNASWIIRPRMMTETNP